MLFVTVHRRLAVTEQGAFPRGHGVTWLCPKMSWRLTHQQTPHPQLAHLPPPGSPPFLQHKFRTPACPPTIALLHILTEEAAVRVGAPRASRAGGSREGERPPCRRGIWTSRPSRATPPPCFSFRRPWCGRGRRTVTERVQTASGSSAHCQEGRARGVTTTASPAPTHSLGKTPTRQPQLRSLGTTPSSRLQALLVPVVPKGIGDLDPQGAPRAPCLSSPLLGGPEERSTRGVSLALIPVGIPGLPGGLTWTVSMTTEKEWSWQSWASRYWQTPLKVKCLSSKLLKWDCPVIRHSPGETAGKRERVSQWVPWGVSQRGALPGFLHTMV